MYRPHCYVPIQAHRANTPQDAEMVLITIWAANTLTALLSVTASASETSTTPCHILNKYTYASHQVFFETKICERDLRKVEQTAAFSFPALRPKLAPFAAFVDSALGWFVLSCQKKR